MATETQIQIVREAPEIEAYKLGLLNLPKVLLTAHNPADTTNSSYERACSRAITDASPATGGIGGLSAVFTRGGYTWVMRTSLSWMPRKDTHK